MRARGLTQDDLGQLVSSMRAYYAGMGCFAPTCGRTSLDLRAWWAVIPGGEHGFLKNLAGTLMDVAPTGAATERTFSHIKWLQAPRRSRLTVEAVHMMTVINTWYKQLQAAPVSNKRKAAATGGSGDGAADGGGVGPRGHSAAANAARGGGADSDSDVEALEGQEEGDGADDGADEEPEDISTDEDIEQLKRVLDALFEEAQAEEAAAPFVVPEGRDLRDVLRADWESAGIDINCAAFDPAYEPPAMMVAPAFRDGEEADFD